MARGVCRFKTRSGNVTSCVGTFVPDTRWGSSTPGAGHAYSPKRNKTSRQHACSEQRQTRCNNLVNTLVGERANQGCHHSVPNTVVELSQCCHQVATALSPGCHQVATRLPQHCHRVVTHVATQWSPSCHHIATTLSPGCHHVVTNLSFGG